MTDPFLRASDIIDFHHPLVAAKALELSKKCNPSNTEELAKICFEYVRDHIQHSGDIKSAGNASTASEVLKAKSAWCFGKSHLLAALLRANNIPAALCYQRVCKDDVGGFTLHGLNSILLPKHGWYRVDPRGNKTGVNAQFTPPHEQLAWPTIKEGEIDFTEKFAEPQKIVYQWIANNTSHKQAFDSLPDETKLT